MEYQEFLEQKRQIGTMDGFEPLFIPDFLFDFQQHLVDWTIKKGRAAIFADCGLGKTPMQLVWAENILRKTNKPVLILTPLAVSFQTAIEGNKFGIECKRSNDGTAHKCITITNYEQLHKFNHNDFSGVVCDESSILKNFDGARKTEITEFMKKMKYRLLATATAAPNDFIELGTSSEALGNMGHIDMLTKYFKNDQGSVGLTRHFGESPKWRLKTHAEIPFWRYITSWSKACRKPSDIGFSDDKFILPELIEREHLIKTIEPPEGMLFNLPALTLPEQREERKRTIRERCEKVLELIVNKNEPALVWCHMNAEGDLLEKIIPGSKQVSGSTPDEEKGEISEWFKGNNISCKLNTHNIIFKICEKQIQNIKSGITENTAKLELSSLSNIRKNIGLIEKNTTHNIIELIERSINLQNSKKKKKTDFEDYDIKPTLFLEKTILLLSESSIPKDHISDGKELLKNLVLLLPITIRCSLNKMAGAQYVETKNAAIKEIIDFMLTTTIKPEECAACFVLIAISELESLKTLQKLLSEQQSTLDRRILISKPKIFGWGINYQHCNHVLYFPSHSYESYYQAVRRCWRFGQKRPVTVDIVLTEGELRVMENLRRKSLQASKMFDNLIREANNSIQYKKAENFTKKEEVPSWL